MSIVRENLMTVKGYSPYCGSTGHCPLPRTHFDGEQFTCRHCGWRSEFPTEFIKKYKRKWQLSLENLNLATISGEYKKKTRFYRKETGFILR